MSATLSTAKTLGTPAPSTGVQKTWALVQNGVVVEVLMTSADISKAFPAGMLWIDASAVSPAPVGGWTYTSGSFAPPVAKLPAAPVPVTQLTPLQFMALLEPSEETAIATAALSNAAILLWLVKTSGASYISLTDPQTVAGVNAMVTAGLLTQARATAILAGQAPPATTTAAAS